MAKNSATFKHVTGADELVGALRALSAAVRGPIIEAGVREAIAPVKVAAKRFAKRSERTGALRESITTKVKVYPSGKAVGMVGPDRKYYRRGKRVSRNVASLAGADRPANYAHLVEFGHFSVEPRKGTTLRKKTAVLAAREWVAAKPFIRPAVMTTLPQQAAGFARGVKREFERAVDKARKTA